MDLDGKLYTVRLVVRSDFAPENPTITFQEKNEYGIWLLLTNSENSNVNQIFIEENIVTQPALTGDNAEISFSEYGAMDITQV